MAKLTGQFTTPRFDAENNKTHEAFLHAVVFVFTSDTTKVTRETDVKGKYSFDLANGEYEVSVYLKGNTEKDRFDMRAGEKFVVTATTKAGALDEWIQVIGTSGKDELATYYENLLAQMQKVFDDFKDETNADGSGLFVKQSSVKKNSLSDAGLYLGATVLVPSLSHGDYGFAWSSQFLENNPGLDIGSLVKAPTFLSYSVQRVFGSSGETIVLKGYNTPYLIQATKRAGESNWLKPASFYSTTNTTVDSNGNIKVASPIIKLFNDHIESNDSFKEKPNFEKMSTGVYKITNTLGLSKNGWTHNIPLNSNGRGYFRVRVEHLEDGCIVRVFKIKNVLNPDTFEIDVVDGDPIDIGKDQRWIDLRFHEEPQQETELLAEMEVEYK